VLSDWTDELGETVGPCSMSNTALDASSN
jgi:hypothetical protein